MSPPLLAGRSDLIEDFEDALADGPGAPGRATLHTGARGTGKTVMLNEVEDLAARQGWSVVSETATPGCIERLVAEHLPALLGEIDPQATTSRSEGVSGSMGLGGASWETPEVHPAKAGLRNQLTKACDLLASTQTGLLITLDEIHLTRWTSYGTSLRRFSTSSERDGRSHLSVPGFHPP